MMFVATSLRPAFLLGHGYPHGVWFYYPVLLTLKAPLGFLGLVALLLALALRLKVRPRGKSRPLRRQKPGTGGPFGLRW